MSTRESAAEQPVSTADDTLGTRLRAERERRGLTLRELARRLEVSPSLFSQIETGKTQPSVRTLYAMVTELGVSLDKALAFEKRQALKVRGELRARSVRRGQTEDIPA